MEKIRDFSSSVPLGEDLGDDRLVDKTGKPWHKYRSYGFSSAEAEVSYELNRGPQEAPFLVSAPGEAGLTIWSVARWLEWRRLHYGE